MNFRGMDTDKKRAAALRARGDYVDHEQREIAPHTPVDLGDVKYPLSRPWLRLEVVRSWQAEAMQRWVCKILGTAQRAHTANDGGYEFAVDFADKDLVDLAGLPPRWQDEHTAADAWGKFRATPEDMAEFAEAYRNMADYEIRQRETRAELEARTRAERRKALEAANG